VNDKEIAEVVRRVLADIAPEADLYRLDPGVDLK